MKPYRKALLPATENGEFEPLADKSPHFRHQAVSRSGPQSNYRRLQASLWLYLLIILMIWQAAGCATQKFLIRRDTPSNSLAAQLQLTSKKGPQISPRTQAMLRRFALNSVYEEDPNECLNAMQQLLDSEIECGLVYSISEIAYILGKKAEQAGDEALALDMYSVAVSNAYMYLFSREFDEVRNPYDPQFRGACDLYNESLESTLRLVNSKGQLVPGQSYQLTTGQETYEVHTLVRGQWEEEDFERFEFVSDFEVEGLPSSGLSYGLGVPLIAVRRRGDESDPREEYYPDGLSFPVTALLRVVKPGSMPGKGADHRHHCVLELHDPLVARDLNLADRQVPLQTDLSKSLAYFLDSPQFREKTHATTGLLNPEKTAQYRGIFMLEPFDPTRIPVIMVHGLWSSPITWMPMFNDLRSFEELRKNYQFWFYRYPTGQPFWLSATQLRQDLAAMRESLDPEQRFQALNHTVMVGHSMGGLVSRMQTIESDDRFWKILSDKPFEEVQGDPEVVQKLRQAAFFEANRDIQRVITIGTPHRGSDFANDTTKWIGRQLIKLPSIMVASGVQLISQNPGVFRNTELLTTATSIDSLSPESPIFPAMLQAPAGPWVRYHNIIGLVPKRTWLGIREATGDGVVDGVSASMDDVVSEIAVESDHQSIHRHPKAIFEVRRILLAHLEDVRQQYRVAGRTAETDQATAATDSLKVPARVVSIMSESPESESVKARVASLSQVP